MAAHTRYGSVGCAVKKAPMNIGPAMRARLPALWAMPMVAPKKINAAIKSKPGAPSKGFDGLNTRNHLYVVEVGAFKLPSLFAYIDNGIFLQSPNGPH